jgi:hypothetical protein
MSTQHTPGPWRIGTTPPNGEQTIGTQQGLMVAVATTGANTPTEANARLIAAAPYLLDAVREFLDMTEEPPEPNCSCHVSPPCGDCVNHAGLRGAFKVARAAIAKATEAA